MSSTMPAIPAARFDHLVTTESGTDLLVYDQQSHHFHHLNATISTVWYACDGVRTVDGIARASGMPIETVQVALSQLADAQLLDGPLDSAVLLGGQSRRRFLKRAAVVGAVAAPALVSVTAPQAAAADSQEAQCWWLSTGGAGYIPASVILPYTPDYITCQELDSCHPGHGEGGTGGCYKWTVSADDDFASW